MALVKTTVALPLVWEKYFNLKSSFKIRIFDFEYDPQ